MSDISKRSCLDHFTGAASEHFAASIYLRQGFQVYWPSMQQSAVDFVVYKDSQFYRIQVKTATWVKSGPFKYLQCRTRLGNKYKNILPADLYDFLVIVAPDRRVWLIPAEVITSSNVCLDGTGPHNNNRYKWTKFLFDLH